MMAEPVMRIQKVRNLANISNDWILDLGYTTVSFKYGSQSTQWLECEAD